MGWGTSFRSESLHGLTIFLPYPRFCPLFHRVTDCYINRFQQASDIGMPIGGGETMTPAWAQRKEELLSDCIVSPDVFNQMVDRLGEFVLPYQQAIETNPTRNSGLDI